MHIASKVCLLLMVLLAFQVSTSLAAERSVQGNVLVSSAEPSLAIRISDSFEYAGVHDFDIRGIAGGTRHVWIDEVDGVIKRIFIVQLEGFYANNEGQYHYDLSTSPEVAGYRWRSNGYAFDLSETRSESPGNESSVTAEFLYKQGFELPEVIMMWRSLTVVNKARTHEAILFLMESADTSGIGLNELYVDDEDTPLWKRIQARMELEFHELVELSPLVSAGHDTWSWERIPVRDQVRK